MRGEGPLYCVGRRARLDMVAGRRMDPSPVLDRLATHKEALATPYIIIPISHVFFVLGEVILVPASYKNEGNVPHDSNKRLARLVCMLPTVPASVELAHVGRYSLQSIRIALLCGYLVGSCCGNLVRMSSTANVLVHARTR